MSVSFLPLTVEPRKLADTQAKLSGELSSASFSRLHELGYSPAEPLFAEFVFSRDEENRTVITGKFEATVTMLCQRCLKEMQQTLSGKFNLVAVATEQAAIQLPEHIDPIVTYGEPVELARIVEDEILLNLPLIAKHDNDSCETKLKANSEEMPVTQDKRKPFQVLEKLLEKKMKA